MLRATIAFAYNVHFLVRNNAYFIYRSKLLIYILLYIMIGYCFINTPGTGINCCGGSGNNRCPQSSDLSGSGSAVPTMVWHRLPRRVVWGRRPREAPLWAVVAALAYTSASVAPHSWLWRARAATATEARATPLCEQLRVCRECCEMRLLYW